MTRRLNDLWKWVFWAYPLREVILKKKLLPFGHVQKGGGVQPESKSFGVVFSGLSFGHFKKKGGGVEPIPKVLGLFLGIF